MRLSAFSSAVASISRKRRSEARSEDSRFPQNQTSTDKKIIVTAMLAKLFGYSAKGHFHGNFL